MFTLALRQISNVRNFNEEELAKVHSSIQNIQDRLKTTQSETTILQTLQTNSKSEINKLYSY